MARQLKNPDFWKAQYVVATAPEQIASAIRVGAFTSGGETFDLVHFQSGRDAPNILISQGSGGHALVFAELGYCLYRYGYNVFIMPKHGGFTISQLMTRHLDAVGHISSNFSGQIGVFGEGLGGFVAFYLALARAPFRSGVYQNAPALLTETKFHNAVIRGGRKALLPVAEIFSKLSSRIKLPISSYLNWIALVDTKEPGRSVESRLVTDGYLKDADFDKWYPLTAIMSLLYTPPPAPLTELATPRL